MTKRRASLVPNARGAAILGVTVALAVAAVALVRRDRPNQIRAADSTRAVRIVRRDRVGLPEKNGFVRDPVHVRAIVEALGVDVHPLGDCPADYAEASFGLVLSGSDVYVKRNVYLFGVSGDGGAKPSVVSVTSAGCRVGPPNNLDALDRELRAAGVFDESGKRRP